MLVVQVESLETTLPPSAGELGTHLRSIQDRLTELSDDVRHLAYQFHPSILDDLGLVVALRRLVDDFSERSGITGTFDCQSSLRFVPQDVATCLYRVAQECLGNVLKHARAGHVRLSLTAAGGEIELVVEDDGVGFDPSKSARREGLGLVSMAERVRLVNGTVTVGSGARCGTRVSCHIPPMKVSV
jgi:signal transduction histidine kinase